MSIWLRVLSYRLKRWKYFEFWPAWFFYLPLVGYYFYLGFKYRNFALPLYSNPSILNSGIIGESKSLILALLPENSPYKLQDILLDPNSINVRVEALNFIEKNQLTFPIILKPDVGQRGSGVVLVQNRKELEDQLQGLSYPTILQEYCAYEEEIGVNYERLPSESRGRIIGITRKRFPYVTGDGTQTLRELIFSDPRARFIAPLYFKKCAADLERVIAQGVSYRLAKIGNHCQGAVFENGWNLYSTGLENLIDEISRQIPGFYVGRFDLRFQSETELAQTGHFKIIELNGAAAEATQIYDAKMKLFQAYKILFAQLDFLFKLGAVNQGQNPGLRSSFWSDFVLYKKNQTRHVPTS